MMQQKVGELKLNALKCKFELFLYFYIVCISIVTISAIDFLLIYDNITLTNFNIKFLKK